MLELSLAVLKVSKQMTLRVLLMSLTVLSFGVGCSTNDESQGANERKAVQQSVLTKEIARKAIIKLAEGPGSRETRPYERVDDLRTGGAIEFVAPDDEAAYYGEFWAVCLERKSFTFSVMRGVHTWHLDGEFRLNQNEWTAIVTKETRAFHRNKE